MYTIETEREDDGRWLAEVVELPGVMAYGPTRAKAVEQVQALALRVLADRLEHGEALEERSARAEGLRNAARRSGEPGES